MKTRIFFLILLSVSCSYYVTAQWNSRKVRITGTAYDVYRSPIVNAIVLIDGQKTSSVTDSKGNFKIRVRRDAMEIGIFTFGNGIIRETINGRTHIVFHFATVKSPLVPDNNIASGEEGVNVGYGSIKRKNLTSDITKINGRNKKYASYSSIYDMLQREVSGIIIHGHNIIIQDSRNFFGPVPPLLVVDGVYVDSIENIQPVTVESIEVLKGTSAQIYGSRGFGGAILIKTRLSNN
jgi:TonB-dependent SusC/RagA subfamily outer membrane receptor